MTADFEPLLTSLQFSIDLNPQSSAPLRAAMIAIHDLTDETSANPYTDDVFIVAAYSAGPSDIFTTRNEDVARRRYAVAQTFPDVYDTSLYKTRVPKIVTDKKLDRWGEQWHSHPVNILAARLLGRVTLL